MRSIKIFVFVFSVSSESHSSYCLNRLPPLKGDKPKKQEQKTLNSVRLEMELQESPLPLVPTPIFSKRIISMKGFIRII